MLLITLSWPYYCILLVFYFQQFDIPDETIRQQPNVFHMAPQTVRVRLQEIENSPDLKLLLQHPKILALVVHHNRANDRLSFLQQSQIRCVPLTILSECFIQLLFKIFVDP